MKPAVEESDDMFEEPVKKTATKAAAASASKGELGDIVDSMFDDDWVKIHGYFGSRGNSYGMSGSNEK